MRLALFLLMTGLLAPVAAQAQKVSRMGVLTATPRATAEATPVFEAFLAELRALGYREGQNLAIEWRHTSADAERRRSEAMQLMAWKPDVVFTASGVDAGALRGANPAVPVVVGSAGDLVGMRLAASLARPGGNVTGLQFLSPELAAKRLQLLKELLPRLRRVAMLHATADVDLGFYDRIQADLGAAGKGMQVEVLRFSVGTAADLEPVFAKIAAAKADAVLVVASQLMLANQRRIIGLAASRKIPAMYESAGAADAGGLIAYGPRVDQMFRRAARYVDRILKGANPAEMPIEQPTTFELIVNRRSAAALGVAIPPSLLARTDRVID